MIYQRSAPCSPPRPRRPTTYIRDRLLAGHFPPGTQLVNRTLAREIGVSPIPVREAISRLTSEGLVAYVPGAGARVRRLDRPELVELYGLGEAIGEILSSDSY